MKNLSKFCAFIFVLILLVSCESEFSEELSYPQTENNNSLRDRDRDNEYQDPIFEESVAVIQRGAIQDPNDVESYIFYIELKDFSGQLDLNDRYTIGNMVYTDNGENHDEVAGDGLYTTIQSYKVLNMEENPLEFYNIIWNISDSFNYEDDLQVYLDDNNTFYKGGDPKIVIGIMLGCKMRIVPCPNTHWWNSCWPFSSPCSCVDFYDCDITAGVYVEVSFDEK